MKNRALRILKLADRFLEKHGVMSIRDWDNIILKVEDENFEEIKKELRGGEKHGTQ